MDWRDEIDELLAKVEVLDLIDFLKPWVFEITETSDEADRGLDRIFQGILEKYEPAHAMHLAFTFGQMFERAMLVPRNLYEAISDLPLELLVQEVERRLKELEGE